jgi:hypothetical protein
MPCSLSFPGLGSGCSGGHSIESDANDTAWSERRVCTYLYMLGTVRTFWALPFLGILCSFGVGVQRADQTSQLCTYEFCMVIALQHVMGESHFSCLLAF